MKFLELVLIPSARSFFEDFKSSLLKVRSRTFLNQP